MSDGEYVHERENRERRNAIIEECALVAESFPNVTMSYTWETKMGIAAAIRALKDKP